MQIKLNLQIFIFIIIFIITHQIEIYIYLMLFVFIHELSHMLVGILLGLKPKSLHIMPFGLSIVFEDLSSRKLVEYKKILVTLAGPMSNLVIILITSFLNINISLKENIIFANILIAIFNMLPIYPLDGGRIINSLLNLRFEKELCVKIVNRISNIVMIIITAASSIVVIYYKNLAILFLIIYLWIIVINENKKYNMQIKVYDIIKKGNKYIDIS